MARKPKSPGLASKLTGLQKLRDEPTSAELIEELRKLLADPSNHVVAGAAEIVGEKALAGLEKEMIAAFQHYMIEPQESDPQCRAKNAIAEALNKVEYAEPEVFLPGIHHRQDVDFDTGQDAAGALRAHSAFGLMRINHPDAAVLASDLLLDPDKTARVGAVRALGWLGIQALPLLRFKTRLGDQFPEVMAECFTALLTIAPAESVPFVALYLDFRNETVQEAAIFALAETRRSDAFQHLKDYWPRTPVDLQEATLLALAMFRSPAANEFLLGVITRKEKAAKHAVSALRIFRHDPRIRAAVAAGVAANGDPALKAWFDKKFPPDNQAPG